MIAYVHVPFWPEWFLSLCSLRSAKWSVLAFTNHWSRVQFRISGFNFFALNYIQVWTDKYLEQLAQHQHQSTLIGSTYITLYCILTITCKKVKKNIKKNTQKKIYIYIFQEKKYSKKNLIALLPVCIYEKIYQG